MMTNQTGMLQLCILIFCFVLLLCFGTGPAIIIMIRLLLENEEDLRSEIL